MFFFHEKSVFFLKFHQTIYRHDITVINGAKHHNQDQKCSLSSTGSNGIRTIRYLDISVLNIYDISVLGTGHFGTRY